MNSHPPRGPYPPKDKRPPEKSVAEQHLYDNIPALLNFKHHEQLSELIDYVRDYIREKGDGITTSQLRNIFGKIKPMKDHKSLQLVRPQLAYVAARQNNAKAKDIVDLLEKVIKEVKVDEQVDDFITFFEAMVAYHKLFHGKKSS